MWSAVRLPRMEAFLIFAATVIVVSLMLANDHAARHAENRRDGQYAVATAMITCCLPI